MQTNVCIASVPRIGQPDGAGHLSRTCWAKGSPPRVFHLVGRLPLAPDPPRDNPVYHLRGEAMHVETTSRSCPTKGSYFTIECVTLLLSVSLCCALYIHRKNTILIPFLFINKMRGHVRCKHGEYPDIIEDSDNYLQAHHCPCQAAFGIYVPKADRSHGCSAEI